MKEGKKKEKDPRKGKRRKGIQCILGSNDILTPPSNSKWYEETNLSLKRDKEEKVTQTAIEKLNGMLLNDNFFFQKL
ncbi:hypothetical protein LguiA_035530 [Lonicera macranthoides]